MTLHQTILLLISVHLVITGCRRMSRQIQLHLCELMGTGATVWGDVVVGRDMDRWMEIEEEG